MKNVAILLSGRGSNFLALSDAIESKQIPAQIVKVVSNRPTAAGLEHAVQRGYSTACIPSKGHKNREAYDRLVVEVLTEARAEIVCLAGFMRILSSYFVEEFPGRILNIHPALLPSFTGLDGQAQALEWGSKISGCTVHIVDAELDHGPIIVQHAVPVLDDDTEDTLSARILAEEHKAYPEALKLMCEDRIQIEGRRVLIV
jgi:phosphoribosylglycinamide formyltransferase-1